MSIKTWDGDKWSMKLSMNCEYCIHGISMRNYIIFPHQMVRECRISLSEEEQIPPLSTHGSLHTSIQRFQTFRSNMFQPHHDQFCRICLQNVILQLATGDVDGLFKSTGPCFLHIDPKLRHLLET